jgi:hypothetical protein
VLLPQWLKISVELVVFTAAASITFHIIPLLQSMLRDRIPFIDVQLRCWWDYGTVRMSRVAGKSITSEHQVKKGTCSPESELTALERCVWART